MTDTYISRPRESKVNLVWNYRLLIGLVVYVCVCNFLETWAAIVIWIHMIDFDFSAVIHIPSVEKTSAEIKIVYIHTEHCCRGNLETWELAAFESTTSIFFDKSKQWYQATITNKWWIGFSILGFLKRHNSHYKALKIHFILTYAKNKNCKKWSINALFNLPFLFLNF